MEIKFHGNKDFMVSDAGVHGVSDVKMVLVAQKRRQWRKNDTGGVKTMLQDSQRTSTDVLSAITGCKRLGLWINHILGPKWAERTETKDTRNRSKTEVKQK
jgi:hypothetical protein